MSLSALRAYLSPHNDKSGLIFYRGCPVMYNMTFYKDNFGGETMAGKSGGYLVFACFSKNVSLAKKKDEKLSSRILEFFF